MQYPGFVSDFLSWLFARPAGDGLDRFMVQYFPWLVTALMLAALLIYLPRYCYEGYTGRYFLNTHRLEPNEEPTWLRFGSRPLRAAIWVIMLFIASRALWLGAVQLCLMADGNSLNAENFSYYINKWDTVNYTRIARDWYGFGDFGDDTYVQEYNIVFFPGFPLMIRALTALVGDYVVSGLILSNAFAIGSGLLLYALVSDMYSEPAARRCCVFFYFSVGACVFSATHSESACMFLTLLAVYLARRRRFVLAVVAGAYATFTRQFGLFAAVPVFYEMLRSLERYPTGRDMIMRECVDTGAQEGSATLLERARRSVRLKHVGKYVALAACVLVGYGAYMAINWAIYGSPTAFLYYQQLNWGNELTPIWNCISITADHLLLYLRDGSNASGVVGIFLPQLVMAVLLPCLMLAFARRGDAGDNAYMWCYVALTFSSTWLISGIRYISAMYPIYIMLGLLSQRRGARWIMYALMLALFLFYNIYYCLDAVIV